MAVTKEEGVVEKERKFKNDDLILCKSICNGQLFVQGVKSGTTYLWADCGDEQEIEYRDLAYLVKSRDKSVYEPRFIIEDADFLKQNPAIEKMYSGMYTTSDFMKIFNLAPVKMKEAIESMPEGAKDSIKGMAATLIDDGVIDSIKKVKMLDEIFGTSLFLTLVDK